MLESWNLAHKSITSENEDLWCQIWPHPPSPQSGTINILHIWTSRTGGSWQTSIHDKERKFGAQINNLISWIFVTSKMTPFSQSPVRNHQHPPHMDYEDRGNWNLAHMSIITYHEDSCCQGWPHPPVRNYQCSPLVSYFQLVSTFPMLLLYEKTISLKYLKMHLFSVFNWKCKVLGH